MKYNDKWAISEFEPKTDVLWVQPGQDEEDESIKINAFVNGKWRAVSGNGGENYPPEDGIPATDLDSDVQSSLSKADTAYQKSTTGIPTSDLASSVQTSLGKADTALQTIKTVNGQSLVGSGDVEILEPGTIETLVIDGTPTAGSSNLITSGGVASEIVWDVTARNSNATFASLSALLSSGSLSTLIPTSVRKGGMQIRFVCSSDNNYVQFRYMKSDAATAATFTNTANWVNVEDEVVRLGKEVNRLVFTTSDKVNSAILEMYSYNLPAELFTNTSRINVRTRVLSSSRTVYEIDFKNSQNEVIYRFFSYENVANFTDGVQKFTMVVDTVEVQDKYLYILVNSSKFSAIENIDCELIKYRIEDIRYSSTILNCLIGLSGDSYAYIPVEKSSVTGKAVGTNGTLINKSSNFYLSNPISINKGDIVTFRTVGGLDISRINWYDSVASTYEPIVPPVAQDGTVAKFIADRTGNVVMSCHNSYPPYLYKIGSELLSLIDGLDGKDGESAYQIAVDNGFTGTEQQWLASLKGDTGATGAQGIQGIQGEQGNSGYSGAAGELEVVNNLVDGGSTAALSAEQGKNLKGLVDEANNFNCRPIVPLNFVPEYIAKASISPSDWHCDSKGSVGQSTEIIYNESKREYQTCVKLISQPATAINQYDSGLFWTALSSGVDCRTNGYRFAICFDKNIPEEYRGYFHVYAWSDNYPDSISHAAHFEVQAQYMQSYPNQTRGGWFMGCVNLDQITLGNTVRGAYFNPQNVTHVGFRFNHITTNANIWVSEMGFVKPMVKPGVVLNIDNFEADVPAMATYAASKGVKLNLSIVTDWIQSGNPSFANVAQAREAAAQGHLIVNHTKSHITTIQTAEEIYDGISQAEDWMLKNGFARGAKIVSNPSSFMNNTRYETYGKSNACVVIYPWIVPTPLNQERYIVHYPYYMGDRMFGETFGDSNRYSQAIYDKAIGNINAALASGGIAFLNFHETWWEQNWKDFIDEITEIDGINFYTLDQLVEGDFI